MNQSEQGQQPDSPASDDTLVHEVASDNVPNDPPTREIMARDAGTGSGSPMTDQSTQPTHHRPFPDDGERPFVTAAQISGPKTPPAERQRQLYDAVFGGEPPAEPAEVRRVWPWAVAISAGIALLGVVAAAFLVGPLRGEPGESAAKRPVADKPTNGATASPKPTTSVGGQALPEFPGTATAVEGTVADPASGLSYANLGGDWRLDRKSSSAIKARYGFTARQYVLSESTGTRSVYAHVMSGPLAANIAQKYTDPEDLDTVLGPAASAIRKRLYPSTVKAKKIAQQPLTVGDRKGALAAFEIRYSKTGLATTKDTIVVAVIDTGRSAPAVLYIAIPDTKDALLPDINTVVKSLKVS